MISASRAVVGGAGGSGRFSSWERELLLVVGRVGEVLADDEHDIDVHRGLRIVAVGEGSPDLHDTAFEVGEIVLILGAGAFDGRFGRLAAGLASSGLLFLAAGG